MMPKSSEIRYHEQRGCIGDASGNAEGRAVSGGPMAAKLTKGKKGFSTPGIFLNIEKDTGISIRELESLFISIKEKVLE